MGDPSSMLPPKLADSSIIALLRSLNEPPPDSIRSFEATAEFHSIYLLSYDARDDQQAHNLILRVSGHHLPGIKTRNEVGMMKTVQQKTQVPIPTIRHFDATVNNAIGHEYTLLDRVPGVSVDTVYDDLSEPQKQSLLRQLLDIVEQLDQLKWDFIGGLAIDDQGHIHPGPVVEETFWQTADIVQHWGPTESVSTLNIAGPYPDFVSYSNAYLQKYIYMISRHASLAWLRDLIPRLEALTRAGAAAAAGAPTLNATRLVLAHRDLHFANIMFDPATGAITGILDWEFSGIVPAARWNPARAFLWSGKPGAAALDEKTRLVAEFQTLAMQRGLLRDYRFSAEQEAYQKVVSYVRALTEVCPRGQQADKVAAWRASAEEGLSAFNV